MNRNGDYMENLFCSYEIALELKELGFDEECLGYYTSPRQNEIYTNKNGEKTRFCLLSSKMKGELVGHGSVRNSLFQWLLDNDRTSGELYILAHSITAPLYSQAIDWFREKHNIHIEVLAIGFEDSSIPEYIYQITDNRMEVIYIDCGMSYRTYEEAREDGILKSITLLQKKK